jgi:hypothetical protein
VKTAYPFVGTTQAFLNTCYQTNNYYSMEEFLDYYFTNTTVNTAKTGLLNEVGLGIMPAAWKTAIEHTFLTPASEAAANREALEQLNLFLDYAGHAAISVKATSTVPAYTYGGQCVAATGA